MRRDRQQPLALSERLPDEAEFAVFEITQPAMDELGARGGSEGAQIGLLDQCDAQTAAGSIPCDARAVDAAPNYKKIEQFDPVILGAVPYESLRGAPMCSTRKQVSALIYGEPHTENSHVNWPHMPPGRPRAPREHVMSGGPARRRP